MSLNFTELNPPEKFRKYHYSDGTSVEFRDVIRVCVRPSGSHRLETKDNKKYVVPLGWRYMELDVDNWTF